MVNMKARINTEGTQVRLEFPDLANVTLLLTAAELENFAEILMNLRSQMKPARVAPPDRLN
jgi:hypothetical protein